MKLVTDPEILSQLNTPSQEDVIDEAVPQEGKLVTDPQLLEALNSGTNNTSSRSKVGALYDKARGVYDKASGVIDKTSELLTESVPASYGAKAGYAVRGPIGALVGGGLGYAGGRVVNRVKDYLQGETEAPTLPESAIETARDFGWGTTMEGVSAGIPKVLGKIAAPFKNKINKQVVKDAADLGLDPTPADLLRGDSAATKGLAQVEGGMGRLLGSGGQIHEAYQKNIKRLIDLRKNFIQGSGSPVAADQLGIKIKDNIDDYLKAIGAERTGSLEGMRNGILKTLGSDETYEQIGGRLKDAISKRSGIVHDITRKAYEKVGKALPEGAQVKTPGLQKSASRISAFLEKSPISSISKSQLAKDANDLIPVTDMPIDKMPESIRNQILGLSGKDAYDWDTLEDLRRYFRDAAGKADAGLNPMGHISGQVKPGKSREARFYKILQKSIEQDQEGFATETGGGISELFAKAKKTGQVEKQIYSNKTLLKLAQSNPEDFAETILNSKALTEVEQVKAAIGNKNFNRIIKPALTKKLLAVDKSGIFDPAGLRNNIANYGDDYLSKIYDQQELLFLKNSATKGISLSEQAIPPKFIKQLSDSLSPQEVVKSIFTEGKSKYTARNFKLMNTVVDEKTKKAMKYYLTHELFTKGQLEDTMSPEGAKEVLSFQPTKLKKMITQYKDVLGTYYSEDELSLLKKIAASGDYLMATEKFAANPSGTGGATAVTSQLSAVGALIATGHPVSAGAVIAGPYIVAKAYLSPMGRRYLSMGLRIPYGSPQSINFVSKLSQIAARNEITDNQNQRPISNKQFKASTYKQKVP